MDPRAREGTALIASVLAINDRRRSRAWYPNHRRLSTGILGRVIHLAHADEESWRAANPPWIAEPPRNSRQRPRRDYEEWASTCLRQSGPHQSPCGCGASWGLRPATPEEIAERRLCKLCFPDGRGD